PPLISIGFILLIALGALFLFDVVLLWSRKGISGHRTVPERLSNGDFNSIHIGVSNSYSFPCEMLIIDELPVQFQKRDMQIAKRIARNETLDISYEVRPVERGEYEFAALNVYAHSPLRLAQRRYRFDAGYTAPVFPSFLQMRKYELMAISNRLTELGIKKIRRVGHQMEFDQIREYVSGDDYRTLNWKATARHHRLMVNQFQDEKAQPVYAVINMGRVMKMPFNGLTLLDYAINASLVLLNIALLKQDKAGLVTFNKEVNTFLPAKGKKTAIMPIMEALYIQKTLFEESDYESLYIRLSRQVRHRSLLVVFTNFEGKSSLRYQLPYLKRMAKQHLVVVVFFKNTELEELATRKPENVEDIYTNTVGAQLLFEKRQIVKELQLNGIHAVLTDPQETTVNTLNKYLEMKARGLI
ncbi:MAG: DUF58 domain-containing protein, partial [Prolixibacteraceae bacterium]|nr:DUF58 domain-containing protein [Prolixibacteraceae bacterium]